MIGLYLLAAHLVGDFLLQNRWMARKKLDDAGWRAYHVAMYCVPFVPIAAVYAHFGKADRAASAVVFLVLLAGLHFATDSRRFRSTFGDWIHWHLFVRGEARLREWRYSTGTVKQPVDAFEHSHKPDSTVGKTSDSLPPNVWPLVSSAVDQTLHLAQLAVLGSIFLT